MGKQNVQAKTINCRGTEEYWEKGCNLSDKEKLAPSKETLLTEDVEMWLQHLSEVSGRSKQGAKKAAATRRRKNKGYTEGNTRESSGTIILKGLKII